MHATALHSYIELNVQDVTPLLHITQSLACLEIVHAAAGLVRTPVFTAVQQVASRLYVVWGILWTVPGVAEGSIVVWRRVCLLCLSVPLLCQCIPDSAGHVICHATV